MTLACETVKGMPSNHQAMSNKFLLPNKQWHSLREIHFHEIYPYLSAQNSFHLPSHPTILNELLNEW